MLRKIYYRIYHRILKIIVLFLKFPEPEVISGIGSVGKLSERIKTKKILKVLIVTDKVLIKLGLLDELFKSLNENDIKYFVFDGVQPNPTIQNIEDARYKYLDNKCSGIIAFGGGSSIDCAKAAGARITNQEQSISQMRGLFKVGRRLPPLFAIPTTAGTGSETTVAAVVTDPSTYEKYAINDLKLVPKIAVLDPNLTIGLPQHITSTTGMDALTHAVEAYISLCGNAFTNDIAEKAVKLIFNNLETAYKDGKNIEARKNMALASFYAGAAFTRAYIGYVHAIAHNLGGLYGVPHGLANAVILPYILEYSKNKIEDKLAKLAVAGGIGNKNESSKILSNKFIEHVKNMNSNMNIPTTIKELQEKDIPLLAKRVLKEANPNYPVPKIMFQNKCEQIIKKLLLKKEKNEDKSISTTVH